MPTHLQFADGMTKMKKALTDTFTKWLAAPHVILGDGTVRGRLFQRKFRQCERFPHLWVHVVKDVRHTYIP